MTTLPMTPILETSEAAWSQPHRSVMDNPSEHPRAYVEQGKAQKELQGLPAGSVRLFNFSPPYLDNVDYEQAAAEGDNRYGWDNLANDNRVPDDHPSKAASSSAPLGNGSSQNGTPADVAASGDVSAYVDEHLRVCKQIERVGAKTSTICIEVDNVRVDGEYQLVDLVGLWRRMIESIGYRIAEEITLGREIAVSRRGAQMMGEGRYRRPGYYAPANVTSTLLVAFRGEVQKRLRRDGKPEEQFSKSWAKRHMKTLWTLESPGKDRMDRTGHPCPQQMRVADAAVRFYSTEGDMVCDPYAGEGTTGIAALQNGRKTALIEPVSSYHAKTKKRVEEEIGEEPARIGAGGSVVVPGEQMHLPIMRGGDREKVEDNVFGDDREATGRQVQMAGEASEVAGAEVTPAIMAACLRAERSYNEKKRRLRDRTGLSHWTPE